MLFREKVFFLSWYKSRLGKRFPLIQKVQTRSGAHTVSYSNGIEVFSLEKSGQGVKTTIDLHIVPR